MEQISILFDTTFKTFWYSFRLIFIFVFCIAILAFVNGCALKKQSTQPEATGHREVGIASYYAKKFNYRKTASGEIFNNNLMTAAHKTLPFGTKVKVKNLHNGKSVKVTINDRGPFKRNRIIDLTRAAFSKIENISKGLTKVEILVE